MRITPAARAQRQAAWLVVAFVGIFLFQRLAIPGLSISVTVPLLLAWCLAGLLAGVLEFDGKRLTLWLVSAGVAGLLIPVQVLTVNMPIISINSWLLWNVTWFPLVLRFTSRTPEAYLSAAKGVAWAGAGISGLSILFIGLQVVGVAYRDLVAELVPRALQLDGFVISYPIAWGSPIYKSNAWLALEPSFLSFMLGVAIVCAIMTQRNTLLVLWLGAGLLCTTAGSGIAVVGVYVAGVILRGRGRLLVRYLALGVIGAVISGATVLGEAVLDRVSEVGDERSSTSLRMLEPYQHLIPSWLADPARTLVGGGPGSSQRVVDDLGILGLLVPTPAKVLYDYGLIGGLLLLAVIVVAFLRSPAPELAFSLAFSMLTLQGSAQPLVGLCLVVITLFAPVTLHARPPGRARGSASAPPRRVRQASRLVPT